jgi:hypothetical protein
VLPINLPLYTFAEIKTLVDRLAVRAHGCTYDTVSSYTDNHAHFEEQNDKWARKAFTIGNLSLRELISIRVCMARMKTGHKRFTILNIRFVTIFFPHAH